VLLPEHPHRTPVTEIPHGPFHLLGWRVEVLEIGDSSGTADRAVATSGST